MNWLRPFFILGVILGQVHHCQAFQYRGLDGVACQPCEEIVHLSGPAASALADIFPDCRECCVLVPCPSGSGNHQESTLPFDEQEAIFVACFLQSSDLEIVDGVTLARHAEPVVSRAFCAFPPRAPPILLS